ncbi:MAG: heavy metal-associated domain-containing protein [bacterium]
MTQNISLTVSGMKCPECADKIQRALQQVPGVTDVAINLAAKMATVTLVQSAIGNEDLVAAVVNVGFGAHVA